MAVIMAEHPTLGTVHGKHEDGVAQFLGIKYASLKDRLSPPDLVDEYPLRSVDATKLGPAVLSLPSGCDAEYGFIQCTLPKQDLAMSELDGLHLNVSVPTYGNKMAGAGEKLPVLVFIHGGGFGVGSNAWPQYDLARIVRLSKDNDSPVIGVGINYRLGLPGLLTSNELRRAGYPGNNAIRDQRTALRWIQKYIAGFGGDPDNVTAAGESAGAVSGTYHLHSEEPLFKRLICMSGSSLLMKPLPPAIHEFIYESTLQALGLKDSSSSEQVQSLLTMPHERMLELIPPSVAFMPLIDEDLFPAAMSFEQLSDPNKDKSLLPGMQWCKSLLIGDCQFDASIFSGMIEQRKSGIARSFSKSMLKSLDSHESETKAMLESYAINEDLPDDEAFAAVLRFATDMCFHAPAMAYAKAWRGDAYVYFFNEPNPWEGPWKGEATHVLDVAYLFQNFNSQLPAPQCEVATTFAKDFINFVAGKAPWPRFDSDKPGAKVYGVGSGDSGAAKFVEGLSPQETGRRLAIFEFGSRIGLDNIASAWNDFFLGK